MIGAEGGRGAFWRVAWASLWARRGGAGLAAASVAVAVALLLSLAAFSDSARRGLEIGSGGVDLVVGGRGAPNQLVLGALHHIGAPANGLRWETAERLARRPEVAWAAPIALGDSHRGYRVVGVTPVYFDRLGPEGAPLAFVSGGRPGDMFDVALGAEVARRLNLAVGARLVISHGFGAEPIAGAEHDAAPFRVSGVLAATGGAVDRLLLAPIEAIEAIHRADRSGALLGRTLSQEALRQDPRPPAQVNALLVGVRAPAATLALQRFVADYPAEPLTAAMPAVAVAELWAWLRPAEAALRLIGWAAAGASLFGVAAALLASVSARRAEIMGWRAVGAGPGVVVGLLMAEAGGVAFVGALFGFALHFAALAWGRAWIEAETGLTLAAAAPGVEALGVLVAVTALGAAVGAVPGIAAYRRSLADGLTPRY